MRLLLSTSLALLCAAGFGMLGLVMHWAWFLVAVLVFTAGEILASPQSMSFVADWAPPAARGRYLSLYQATWSIGFAVNPTITLPLHAASPLLPSAFALAESLRGVIAQVLLRKSAEYGQANRLQGFAYHFYWYMASPLAAPRGRLHLVMEGGQQGEVYDLNDETVVGRTNGDITFPHDGFMSGRHATIRAQPGRNDSRVGREQSSVFRIVTPTRPYSLSRKNRSTASSWRCSQQRSRRKTSCPEAQRASAT